KPPQQCLSRQTRNGWCLRKSNSAGLDGSMTLNSELLAALIFLFFGAVAVIVGWGYGLGSPSALGSGAMPVLTGVGLVLMGSIQLARTSAAHRAGERLLSAFPRSERRPLLVILAAILAFGLLIHPLGLIPALTALIAI